MTSPERGARPSRDGPKQQRVWSVLELLRWTTRHFAERGIESARLDAECLLAHALGSSRLSLYLDFEKPIHEPERRVFRELVRRRGSERVPVAQLIGEKEFWSLPLRITKDVLVPRPETETLVAAALDLIPDREAAWRVLDVGTGSGAVALAIARERPASVIAATDVSQEALKIAQENAERLGVGERIRFREGCGMAPVEGESFDLVVSNPPYVAEGQRGTLAPELAHEPAVALFAGPEGLEVLLPLIDAAPRVLAPGGALALEHAPDQAGAVRARCEAAGLGEVVTHRDIGGRMRVTAARRPVGGERPRTGSAGDGAGQKAGSQVGEG